MTKTISKACPDSTASNSDVGTAAAGFRLFEDYPDLLTIKDLHELTGLSEQTLRTEVNSGRIPGCRIGRRLFVSKARFMEYVERKGGM